MIEYLTSFEFTSTLSIFVYWAPLVICLLVYTFRCIAEYRTDIAKSANEHYSPTLTVGVILWRAILSTVPCVNLFAMVFDCASSVFKSLGRFFDIPLVPKQRGESQ